MPSIFFRPVGGIEVRQVLRILFSVEWLGSIAHDVLQCREPQLHHLAVGNQSRRSQTSMFVIVPTLGNGADKEAIASPRFFLSKDTPGSSWPTSTGRGLEVDEGPRESSARQPAFRRKNTKGFFLIVEWHLIAINQRAMGGIAGNVFDEVVDAVTDFILNPAVDGGLELPNPL